MLNFVDHYQTSYQPLITQVVNEAYKVFNLEPTVTVNVILVSDRQMTELHTTFAQKEKTTDVLTFPSGLDDELGDIFISIDQAKAQALSLGHRIEREVAFLCVHGILHCLGFTHETDEQLKVMTDHQEAILNAVGQPRSK